MPEEKEYSIATVEDVIKKIPLDRLDAFLEDFKVFVITGKKHYELLQKFPNEIIEKIKFNMVRVDDGTVGLRGEEIHVKIKD